MVRRIAGIVVVIIIVGGTLTVLAHGWAWRNPVVTVTQPIAFSHQTHIAKAKLDCTTICHSAAATEVYAGLPSKDVCYGCHDPDEETPDSPELTRLAGYVDSDADLPWQRVAILPSHVFFSHRRHVTAGGLKCERCHPGVARAEGPLTKVALVMRMANCLACHQERGASVDCLACHR